jgi:hypothetical protein
VSCVLPVDDCGGTAGTARSVGVSRLTAIKGPDRFVALGAAGLDDKARSGPLPPLHLDQDSQREPSSHHP